MKNSVELNASFRNAGERARALHEAITRRAGELYQLRGCVEGHALEDWLQAEEEVIARFQAQESSCAQKPAHKSSFEEDKPQRLTPGLRAPRKSAFFNVKVDDVLYTVEYDPAHCDSYRPGMFRKGQAVQVRVEEDKVYMKLPDSKELEAKIVRRGQAK